MDICSYGHHRDLTGKDITVYNSKVILGQWIAFSLDLSATEWKLHLSGCVTLPHSL